MKKIMKLLKLPAAFLTAFLAVFSASANADSLDLSFTFNSPSGGGPGFYVVNNDFSLPSGFSNATISISNLGIDDRGAVLLNGVIVDAAGIFGPGLGQLRLSANGPDSSYFYSAGNGARNTVVNSGFLTGLNTFAVLVNDTDTGISGVTLTTAGPTSFYVSATLNYAPVPEPAAWLSLLLGLGMLGASYRRN